MQFHIQNQHPEGLGQLYQEVVLDHFKRPRFKGHIQDCRFCKEGKNPVCGDVINLYCRVLKNDSLNQALKPEENVLQVYFEGIGCSISQASASIMCELVHNCSVPEAKKAIQMAENIYTGVQNVDPENMSSDLDALHGISQFPARVKCAALPWKTLECLVDENFDSQGCPLAQSCNRHLTNAKQKRKLRVVTTEVNI